MLVVDSAIIHALNAINRRFYAAVADDFSTTRAKAWRGWRDVLPHIPMPSDRPLRVLDVGCGNGRFAAYLVERLRRPIAYHGVDFSDGLLARAAADLHALPDLTITLETRDVIEGSLPHERYDVVAAFGVLHHIPGADHRQAFVHQLADRVAPGGVLAWTEWRFYEQPRFHEHLVAFPPALAAHIETQDYLLDWKASPHAGDSALRYCHYIDDAESETLVAAARLDLITTYRADGDTRDGNRYVLMRRTLAARNDGLL